MVSHNAYLATEVRHGGTGPSLLLLLVLLLLFLLLICCGILTSCPCSLCQFSKKGTGPAAPLLLVPTLLFTSCSLYSLEMKTNMLPPALGIVQVTVSTDPGGLTLPSTCVLAVDMTSWHALLLVTRCFCMDTLFAVTLCMLPLLLLLPVYVSLLLLSVCLCHLAPVAATGLAHIQH